MHDHHVMAEDRTRKLPISNHIYLKQTVIFRNPRIPLQISFHQRFDEIKITAKIRSIVRRTLGYDPEKSAIRPNGMWDRPNNLATSL
jgi:hypothetical protein